jgi:Right handed beta helix region/Pectate lyase superfamily protein
MVRLLPLLFIFILLRSVHAADLSAVADGKTDATAAIQAFIDRNAAQLVLPKGQYRLSRPLRVELDKIGHFSLSGHGLARLIMTAPGAAIQLTGTHAGTADPSSVKTEIWDRQRMPLIDGIEIIGAHPEADGISADGLMQLTVTASTIRDCRHGIHLINRNRNIILSHCHIYQNSGIGIYYDHVNLHQSNIIGSHISYCMGGGIVSRGGNVRNLHIGTCDIESNMGVDHPATANVLLDSTGGSIGEVAITGCTIQHSSKGPDSANIWIMGKGSDEAQAKRTGGELATKEGHITIGNNVFSDIQFNLRLQDSRGITVTGNTFWEGFQHDILAERCENLVIANNNFDRNPRYIVNGFALAERNGLVIRDCRDSTITGNIIRSVQQKRAAIDIIKGHRLTIANNSILDSDGIGLLLEACSHSMIHGNLIRDDRAPTSNTTHPASIQIDQGQGNSLSNNQLSHGEAKPNPAPNGTN